MKAPRPLPHTASAFLLGMALMLALVATLSAVGCAAPGPVPEPMPAAWGPSAELCGIWATDLRAPAGGLLPERLADADPTDSVGVAVHHIVDVRVDRYGRETAYRIRSYSRGSGDSCDRWVSPEAFPAWTYWHPYAGWHATRHGAIATTQLSRWAVGDSIPVRCIYDATGLRIVRWLDVYGEAFRPCR